MDKLDNLSNDELKQIIINSYDRPALNKKLSNKRYYNNNKNYFKEYYLKNKELYQARNKYYYYKNNDKLDVFIEKFPNLYKLINNNNI